MPTKATDEITVVMAYQPRHTFTHPPKKNIAVTRTSAYYSSELINQMKANTNVFATLVTITTSNEKVSYPLEWQKLDCLHGV